MTQKLSAIYKERTSSISERTKGTSSGLGMALGTGQMGFMLGSTEGRVSGIQQTELAKMAAPPKEEEEGWLTVALIGAIILGIGAGSQPDLGRCLGFLAGVVSLFVFLCIIGFILPRDKQREATLKAKYVIESAERESKLYCHRCGQSFIPATAPAITQQPPPLPPN
jgi:hypothetical protein